MADYGIPGRDYFHVLTEHPAGQILAQDAGLGFKRTPDVVMVQIFTRAVRSQGAKQSPFGASAENLAAPAAVKPAAPCGYLNPLCHLVNMSVQTFDSTWILGQSSGCGPAHAGFLSTEAQAAQRYRVHTRKVRDHRDPRTAHDRAHQR